MEISHLLPLSRLQWNIFLSSNVKLTSQTKMNISYFVILRGSMVVLHITVMCTVML